MATTIMISTRVNPALRFDFIFITDLSWDTARMPQQAGLVFMYYYGASRVSLLPTVS
jgi:hypothetical protein